MEQPCKQAGCAFCRRLSTAVFFEIQPMITNRGWVVYCTQTETVIGHWFEQADAEQFYKDALVLPDGTVDPDHKWAVFPALECTELLEV